jgi:hypothetical protein
MLVEDYDLASADQEAPLTPNAVVKPRWPPEQFAVTLRSDYEVVLERSRVPNRRFLTFAP